MIVKFTLWRKVWAYPSQRGQLLATVLSGRHLPIRKLCRAPSHNPPIFLLPHHLFYHDDWCFIYWRFIKLRFYSLCGYLCCCELLPTCSVVFLMWRHVKSIFVCFRLQVPSVYFGIFNLWCVVGHLERAAKVRMHKNTPCTVFSALNKSCCILLWTLLYTLLSGLSITCIKHQKNWQ